MEIKFSLDPYKIIYDTSFKKKIISVIKSIESEKFIEAPADFLNKYDSYYDVIEKHKDVENVVVCGTGANALYLDVLKQFSKKNLIIMDSTSPYKVDEVLKLDKEKTAIVYISRSGNTLEVISLYYLFHNKFKRNIVLANSGQLKKLGTENKDIIIPIRLDLSGRYMFATQVVSIPAYLLGINYKEMLLSAIEIVKSFGDFKREEFKDLDEMNFNKKLKKVDNKALILSIFIFYFYHSKEEQYSTIWATSYDDFLSELPNVFNQLVNESTGKDGSNLLLFHKNAPRAQHELIQRINGGKHNIIPLILTVKESLVDFKFEKGSLLKSKSANDIVNIEAKSTMSAFSELRIPFCHIELTKPTLKEVTRIFMLAQFLAYFLSRFLDVNPFDNPDVDLGKEFARKMLKGL